ncbi:MAG: AzlC family ABC transporter permease [Alphaproteobacteria bacterium]|nr:AzlC family ABC transporter permease [Alphaproteobacteria bacterium]
MSPPPFTSAGVLRGARLMIGFVPSSIAFGLGFGLAADQAGLSLLESTLMSALLFAGTSQLAALQIWTAPLPFWPIVITVMAVNSRQFLMSATMRPWFGRLPRWRAYLTLGLLVDANWAVAMRERARGDQDAGVFLGAGLVLYVFWTASSALGHAVGAMIPDPRALALDYIVPGFCVVLLLGMWRGKGDLVPWLVAAATAVLVATLVPGNWHVLAGGLAGSLVGAFGRDPR